MNNVHDINFVVVIAIGILLLFCILSWRAWLPFHTTLIFMVSQWTTQIWHDPRTIGSVMYWGYLKGDLQHCITPVLLFIMTCHHDVLHFILTCHDTFNHNVSPWMCYHPGATCHHDVVSFHHNFSSVCYYCATLLHLILLTHYNTEIYCSL